MTRAHARRDPTTRAAVRDAFNGLAYEIIPFKKTEAAVLAHVPLGVRLTITASPTKGQDVTVDMAVSLARHGYRVTPHLSAQQIRDRVHLRALVSRCRDAGITEVFVVGGDRTDTPTEFKHAHDLLVALNELDPGFTEIGVAGHPEGHPDASEDELLDALAAKAELATYVTTQIVFDPQVIVAWSGELRRRHINLPIRVGVPGVVHRQKLIRVSGGLGLGESARFLKKHQSMFWRFFVPGGYSPDRILRGLAPHFGTLADGRAVQGMHVFTFNDLEPTEKWRRRSVQKLR